VSFLLCIRLFVFIFGCFFAFVFNPLFAVSFVFFFRFFLVLFRFAFLRVFFFAPSDLYFLSALSSGCFSYVGALAPNQGVLPVRDTVGEGGSRATPAPTPDEAMRCDASGAEGARLWRGRLPVDACTPERRILPSLSAVMECEMRHASCMLAARGGVIRHCQERRFWPEVAAPGNRGCL
jgi:hypothetical protein